MSQKFDIQIMLHSNADSDTLEQFVTLQDRCKVTGVILTDTAGITQNAANYRTISCQKGDGSQTYFSWSTQDSAQGTIAAATAVDMINPGTATDDPEFEAGSAFKIRSAASGAGVAQQTSVTVKCERLRKYS